MCVGIHDHRDVLAYGDPARLRARSSALPSRFDKANEPSSTLQN
jgi:hypothetical protein